MDETKHKTIPFKDTIDVSQIIGEQVLTSAGKNLGKVKSVHIHPKDLTVEGIVLDQGMFKVDQYFDAGYIETLNLKGVVLKIEPIDEFVGKEVFDPTGKKIGKVTGINKSKQTNTLLSIKVNTEGTDSELVITSDYIAAVSEKALMLKEPFNLKDE
ncbi:MAG: PRC-barrel domain-containing protein [archaeon]